MELFALVISIIALVVFFVMASNISTLVTLGRKQTKQNEELIRLLGGGSPSDRPKESEPLTAKDIHERAMAARYKDK